MCCPANEFAPPTSLPQLDNRRSKPLRHHAIVPLVFVVTSSGERCHIWLQPLSAYCGLDRSRYVISPRQIDPMEEKWQVKSQRFYSYLLATLRAA